MTRVLFVNLTRLCNVDCPRCYLTPENRASRKMLDPGMLEKCLRDPFFSGGEAVVIFQGGEPFLLGERRLREMTAVAREALPGASMTAVSNLFSLPDWAVDLAKEAFGGRIETTWAGGAKTNLSGNPHVYQKRFRKNLAKAVDAGLSCPVNVELNRETFAMGPGVILDLVEETGVDTIEFDLSIRFDDFRKNPSFEQGNYPCLPPGISHAEFRDFVLEFRRGIFTRGLSGRVRSSIFRSLQARLRDPQFNVGREGDFVTLNPDGTITTIPLFSDIEETYLGSVLTNDLGDVLKNPNRQQRMDFERRRSEACRDCEYFSICGGGPSHIPVHDGSGECAGMKSILDRMN